MPRIMKYFIVSSTQPYIIDSEHPINIGDEIAIPPSGTLFVVTEKVFKISVWPEALKCWEIVEKNPDVIVALYCYPPETAKRLNHPPIKSTRHARFEGSVEFEE